MARMNRARAGRGRQGTAEVTPDMPSREPTPEERLLEEERRAELSRALSELTAGEQLLFYRKYYYRQPTEQIAAELGMTTRAVEGRLYRLKRRLREKLEGGRA